MEVTGVKWKRAEVLEDAVKQYLEEQSWRAFVGKAEVRNRASGRTEDDVPQLIAEARKENRERGGR
jgi:hypothetical protein